MDFAYDHITEEALAKDNAGQASQNNTQKPEQQATLNEDLKEAYRAISSSAWGSTLGGFFGNVVKQVRTHPPRPCPPRGTQPGLTPISCLGLGRVGLP